MKVTRRPETGTDSAAGDALTATARLIEPDYLKGRVFFEESSTGIVTLVRLEGDAESDAAESSEPRR